MMRNLAIVPARGGSKRLPRKNILPLNGKPLIHYTLEAVVNSNQFKTVILSSDDNEILELGTKVKGVTPEKREAELAGDKVKVIDLIKKIADREGYENEYDTIGLFLPTCPFRTSWHIQEGIKLLHENDYSVVSVNEMNDPVQLSLSIGENNIINPEAILQPSPLVTGNTRSQDFDKIYRANGGFYISWLKKFKKKDNFFQGKVKGYVMEQKYFVDIDYEIDFKWAEFMLQNNYLNLNK